MVDRIKQYTDEELRAIAAAAVKKDNYAKTMPDSLVSAIARGLLVERAILPLEDRTPRLAKILKQVILEQK